MPNIYQTAMFHALRSPRSTALSDRHTAMDFAALCARARALTAHLQGLGVRRGDRVAVLMHNAIDYLALMHATAVGGFSLVPVNTRYSAAELAFLISDCTPRVLVHDAEFSPLVAELPRHLTPDQLPVCLDHLASDLADVPATADPVAWRTGCVEDGDVAIIMYTSGTTSTP